MEMCSCILKQAELEGSLGSGWDMSLGGSLGKLASPSCSFQFSLSSLFQEQASVHVFLKSGVQASHSPSVSPTSCPTSLWGSSSLCRTPGLVCPVSGWNHSLPGEDLCPCNLPPLLSPIQEAWPDGYFCLDTNSMWIFLTALVEEESFCQSPVIFPWGLFQWTI